jgi:hypothetical protein
MTQLTEIQRQSGTEESQGRIQASSQPSSRLRDQNLANSGIRIGSDYWVSGNGSQNAPVLATRINLFWGLGCKAMTAFMDESWGQETDILIARKPILCIWHIVADV